MTSRQIGRVNQQSKGETPLVGGILQRAAVRAVADQEVEGSKDVVDGSFSESRFQHDFSQVPTIQRANGVMNLPMTSDEGNASPVSIGVKTGEGGEKVDKLPAAILDTQNSVRFNEIHALQYLGSSLSWAANEVERTTMKGFQDLLQTINSRGKIG